MPFWNVFHARTSIAHALTGGSHSREKELEKNTRKESRSIFSRSFFHPFLHSKLPKMYATALSLSCFIFYFSFFLRTWSPTALVLVYVFSVLGKVVMTGGRWEGTINSSSFSFASLCQCLFGAYMTYTTDSGTFLCWLGWRRRRRRRRFVGLGLGRVGSGLGNLLPFSTCSHSLSFFLQWNVFVQLDAPGLVWFMTHIAIAVLVHQKWQKQ